MRGIIYIIATYKKAETRIRAVISSKSCVNRLDGTEKEYKEMWLF